MNIQTGLRIVFAAAAIGVAAITAYGQAEPAAPVPDGKTVLDRMVAHYKTVPGVSVTLIDKPRGHAELTGRVAIMARPNLVSIRHQELASMQIDIVCDGTRLSQALGGFNVYSSNAAPATMGEVSDACSLEMELKPIAVLSLSTLLAMTMMDEQRLLGLLQAFPNTTYVGGEEANGVRCDRVHVSGPGGEADLWVQSEGSPWLQRVRSVERRRTSVIERDVLLKNWQVKPDLKSEHFEFVPPDGFKKVDSLGKHIEEDLEGG